PLTIKRTISSPPPVEPAFGCLHLDAMNSRLPSAVRQQEVYSEDFCCAALARCEASSSPRRRGSRFGFLKKMGSRFRGNDDRGLSRVFLARVSFLQPCDVDFLHRQQCAENPLVSLRFRVFQHLYHPFRDDLPG